MLIVLDPGHGGNDPGAVGNGLRESDITLETSLLLQNELKKYENVKTILTRESNISLALAQRTDTANRVGADLFVSIHVNAGGGNGTETFFANTKQNDRILAQHITDDIATGMPLRNRGARPDTISAVGSLAVLRNTKMPAVLVELAFIDAPLGHNDVNTLRLLRKRFAEIIANSIASFYKLKESGEDMESNCNPERDKDLLAPWAKEPWEWATANALTDGTRPNDFITRQEVVTLLYRYEMKRRV